VNNGADNATNGTGQAPASRQPLSPEAIESVASWLRVIADPTRIRLMQILKAGSSSSVQGLACQLGTSRPNISKHLGVLRQAGIVRRRKVGSHALYELVDWSGWWMVEQASTTVASAEAGIPEALPVTA
jgi:ArsR family transcriptional regulator, arsenate/arsenite/antimonite-responsive transcriptional repressor